MWNCFYQIFSILFIHTVYGVLGGSKVSTLDEVVLIERIDLIARLSIGCQCQKNDREVALIWIAELTTLLTDQLGSLKKDEISINQPKFSDSY